MIKIAFIGAGNVATSLAINLHQNGFSISQVYSKTVESAKILAEQVGASYTNQINDVATDASLYIFSIKDSVLEQLISQLPYNDGIWIHTAGSMPLNVFSQHASRYGVIYPLQTFTKGRSVDWKNIPIFIEGSDSSVSVFLKKIANQISDNVRELSSEKRNYVHLTGVFACNFANHMFSLSEQILKKADLPFDLALPLIQETCAKIQHMPPIEAQTGPAVRFDENVMNKHLELIDKQKIKDMYRIISESIYDMSKNK